MKKSAGTSYHCANFNNLFFQIQGRKRWTFVDSRYNALMYPMFNPKSMDVASFLTSIAINDTEIMTRYFPLYKFAPKMVATLEPGDVLFNPPVSLFLTHFLGQEGTVHLFCLFYSGNGTKSRISRTYPSEWQLVGSLVCTLLKTKQIDFIICFVQQALNYIRIACIRLCNF